MKKCSVCKSDGYLKYKEEYFCGPCYRKLKNIKTKEINSEKLKNIDNLEDRIYKLKKMIKEGE